MKEHLLKRKVGVKLIFNLAVTNPLFLELVHQLKDSGYEVMVYDFVSSRVYNPQTRTTYAIKSYWWAPKILKIKYLRRLFIPIINRKCVRDEFNINDVVNIHYVEKAYSQYARNIKQKGCRLITTFWGSDYLRASDESKKAYQPLLVESDLITMVDGVLQIFHKEFPEYQQKLRTTYFGLKLLEFIKEVSKTDISSFKKKYNVPIAKKIIAIGYNGHPAQQHLKILGIIKRLPNNIKQTIHLILPFTYGGDFRYKAAVKKAAEEIDVSSTIFEQRLSDTELAQLRCASNIVINMQKTDAFSGSISESLAAESLVIVGDWLPYDIYDKWGVRMVRSSEKDMQKTVEDAVSNMDNWSDLSCNKDIIYERLRWPAVIKWWAKVYD